MGPLLITQSSEERKRLDGTLVSGVAWTGAGKWLSQVVSWVSTLTVARLIAPEDYGLVGMATVYIGFVAMINEFGLGTAIVRLNKLDHRQIAQLNTVAVLVGLAGFVVSCLAANPIAAFYGVPHLRWVLIVMSSTFVITAFRSIPVSLLQRDLKFRQLAAFDGLQVVATAGATVAFAFLGFQYWALALGPLLGAMIGTLSITISRPQGFAIPRPKSLIETIAFSQQVLFSQVSWYFLTNADFLVAGKVLGRQALGFYSFAWTLASLPVDKIASVINQVTFPIFSAVQHNPAEIRRYFLRVTEAVALVTFPLAFGLALVSEQFVQVVLGPKWIDVVIPLQLLALYASLKTITPMLAQILFVTGESRYVLNLSLIAAVVMPVAFLIGSRWGTTGIALGWVLVHPFFSLAAYRQVFKKIELAPLEYIRSLIPAVSAAVPMVVAVIILKRTVPAGWPVSLHLGFEIVAGATAYVLTLFWFHPERLQAFSQFLSKPRGII